MFDVACETLFHFLEKESELLHSATDALFLRAQVCPQLALFSQKQLTCQQTFKPHFDALVLRGLHAVTDFSGAVDVSLCLGSKQRDENFILFAAGIDALRHGGTFLSCLPKDLGAGRFEKELHKVGGQPLSYVKNHCRVFGITNDGTCKPEVLEQWRSLARMQTVSGTCLLSRPGVFGWDKIDQGSQLLVSQLPALRGSVAALGSGYGFLSQHVLQSSELRELHLFEAEKIALDASRESLLRDPQAPKLHFHWHDVSSGLPEKSFDAIVTNPPFHTGKQVNIALGEKFIQVAARALKKEGALYLVANSSLPYERTLQKHFRVYEQLISQRGFKVLKAVL
ncbi:MAG: methyltransferase [Deltaproteobacteria bacterium]|nr:methyltransferase [Deltaproteobacteria bacterium]